MTPVRPDHRVEGPGPVRRPLPQHPRGPAGRRHQPDPRLADHRHLRCRLRRRRPRLGRRAEPQHRRGQPVHPARRRRRPARASRATSARATASTSACCTRSTTASPGASPTAARSRSTTRATPGSPRSRPATRSSTRRSRRSLPFDRDLPVETAIEFPDMASLGLAFGLTPNLLLETDVNWTGWSSFDEVLIDFVGTSGNAPARRRRSRRSGRTSYNYRAGLRWTVEPGHAVRFGYVFDETPQPEEAVSPAAARRRPQRHHPRLRPHRRHRLRPGAHVPDVRRAHPRPAASMTRPDFFGTYNTEAWLLRPRRSTGNDPG